MRIFVHQDTPKVFGPFFSLYKWTLIFLAVLLFLKKKKNLPYIFYRIKETG